MSKRWTESDLMRVTGSIQQMQRAPMSCKRSKYGNRKVQWQGQVFDSEHERDMFRDFELERIAGGLRAVVRQVSFKLPGCDRRIRVDFMLVYNDGSIRWVDAKGFATEAWKLKQAQIRQAYGITIETV